MPGSEGAHYGRSSLTLTNTTVQNGVQYRAYAGKKITLGPGFKLEAGAEAIFNIYHDLNFDEYEFGGTN